MNTDEPELRLSQAERRVLEIQTKLHRWARDDPHRRFDDLFAPDPAGPAAAKTQSRTATEPPILPPE